MYPCPIVQIAPQPKRILQHLFSTRAVACAAGQTSLLAIGTTYVNMAETEEELIRNKITITSDTELIMGVTCISTPLLNSRKTATGIVDKQRKNNVDFQ
jgi:hypothetical protein